MNDDRNDREGAEFASLSAEERRMLERLQAMPAPVASAAAKARARGAFVSGEGAQLRIERESRGPGLTRWAGVLAAAAALVFLFIYGAQPRDTWRVTDVVEAVGVEAQGGATAVGVHIVGGRIATGLRSEVELQLGQDLRVRLLPGTSVELPTAPGRWFGRRKDLELASGEIYGTTGGKPLGWHLTLSGEGGRAELTGTTFAIILEGESTCFCLFEGGLDIDVFGTGETLALPVERRITIAPDGGTKVEELRPMERMKLQMLFDMGLVPPE